MNALGNLGIKWTAYIPHRPLPKQRTFLWLPHEEAFYGGAAGGGKSDCLLMGALQYVDVPGYAGLIVRKTLADAKKPGSILFRSKQWLSHTDARWSESENTWYFPSGATLTFAKLANVGDAFNFQSTEFQYMGFDELTHFYEHDFDYVITTRLRRTECPDHTTQHFDPKCPSCYQSYLLSQVPLRVRSASNPGGMGHLWVKRRYKIRRIPGKRTPTGAPLWCGTDPERPHIPAFVYDNPHIGKDYVKRLGKLKDKVTMRQMLDGDWGVSEEGRFKQSWIKRYEDNGVYITTNKSWLYNQLENFLIIDPAASTVNLPGTKEVRKRQSSHTVASWWSLSPEGDLILRKAKRHQKEVPETKAIIREFYQECPSLQFVGMEYSTMSTHLYQIYQMEGLNMKPFPTHTRDKVARSVDATNRMESGKVWYPEHQKQWLQDWEDEIWTWTGDPSETDDQVDCQSYASIYATERFTNTSGETSRDDLPGHIHA